METAPFVSSRRNAAVYHHSQNLCVRIFHSYFADVSHVSDGIFDIVLDKAFAAHKAFIVHTHVVGEQSGIYGRRNSFSVLIVFYEDSFCKRQTRNHFLFRCFCFPDFCFAIPGVDMLSYNMI